METKLEWTDDGRVVIDPPSKPKKLTATRFATVMGLNHWSAPFGAWCQITRVWEDPFVESQYTLAGKIIEGKVIDYLNNVYFMGLKTPTDVYGADYFKKTRGDFFPDQPILGGMWDALGEDFVVEIKTTKRAEDWAVDVPLYYKLQACLYAYMLGFKNVVMTVTFLGDADYPVQRTDGTWDTSATEAFEPSIENTKVYEFTIDEAFPFFEDNYVVPALNWWHTHVETGISPQYDEKRDADILKALRKTTVEPNDKEIAKLVKEADKLKASIDKAEARIAEKKERLKEIDGVVRDYLAKQIPEGGKTAELAGRSYTWTVTRKAGRKTLDGKALKADMPEIYAKYEKGGEPTYSLTKKGVDKGGDGMNN